MSFSAAVFASSGSERSSSVMTLILRPFRTPVWLISSRASVRPSLELTPKVAVSPVREATWPMMMSPVPGSREPDCSFLQPRKTLPTISSRRRGAKRRRRFMASPGLVRAIPSVIQGRNLVGVRARRKEWAVGFYVAWASRPSASSPFIKCSGETLKPRMRLIRALRPAHVRRDRVQRCPRRDEQRLPVRTAEAEVCGGLGDGDPADQLPVRRKDLHAVAGARPDVSLFVAPDAVGDALVDRTEHSSLGERVVRLHVEHADVPRLAGVGDVQLLFVRRKT